MFPKKNRISKKEFKEILTVGRVFHSPSFSLRGIKSSSLSKRGAVPPKFAFVVSKKIAKTAVERNKMRRRGFHALREIIFCPGIAMNAKMNGFSCAFFFKKEGKEMKFDELKREIKVLLEKSGEL
jgi:ribonuclease P protein component